MEAKDNFVLMYSACFPHPSHSAFSFNFLYFLSPFFLFIRIRASLAHNIGSEPRPCLRKSRMKKKKTWRHNETDYVVECFVFFLFLCARANAGVTADILPRWRCRNKGFSNIKKKKNCGIGETATKRHVCTYEENISTTTATAGSKQILTTSIIAI